MIVTEKDILKAKILIVDDDLTTLKILENLLKNAGYVNVNISMDPTQVKNIYAKLQPDLVVLDLLMPKMDGFSVMEEIKTIESNYAPIVMLTNEEDQEIKYKALGLGARDFLNKPYDRIEVLMRFHNLIESRLLHKSLDEKGKILAYESIHYYINKKISLGADENSVEPNNFAPGNTSQEIRDGIAKPAEIYNQIFHGNTPTSYHTLFGDYHAKTATGQPFLSQNPKGDLIIELVDAVWNDCSDSPK